MNEVKPDHFLRQFDRYAEGEERFAALAAHAAYLLNALHKEQAAHNDTVAGFLEQLAEANPLVKVALDLKAFQASRSDG